jgi:hypothetical protein
MKLFFQGTAILALLISNASAAQSGIFVANGVELDIYQSGEDIIYGEPVSRLSFGPSYIQQLTPYSKAWSRYISD